VVRHVVVQYVGRAAAFVMLDKAPGYLAPAVVMLVTQFRLHSPYLYFFKNCQSNFLPSYTAIKKAANVVII
ncbi:hypothetical protein, partial [Parapedobacter composti]|uniref:hypothetical protein n=1 Tax=Parapedobacter composti TaxID=623281 RepID=UPI001B8ADCB4